jgi:hypothetical protein
VRIGADEYEKTCRTGGNLSWLVPHGWQFPSLGKHGVTDGTIRTRLGALGRAGFIGQLPEGRYFDQLFRERHLGCAYLVGTRSGVWGCDVRDDVRHDTS